MKNTDSYKNFEDYVHKSGDTYAFSRELSVGTINALLDVVRDIGLNPLNTEEFRQGIMRVFNVEIHNLPDLERSRFIFAPNHVSDFDAVILGLLHPGIRIVSKTDWIDNAELMRFINLHYDLYGLDRASLRSLRTLLTDSISYFNDSAENRHFLIFSQGTISDFNNNSPERIAAIAPKISQKTGVPIVSVFMEQVSLEHPTRIVFDEPMQLPTDGDFRKLWLEREARLQDSLNPPARKPKLTHKHMNNNKPGDPFFAAKIA